jgi:hypothetical protein
MKERDARLLAELCLVSGAREADATRAAIERFYGWPAPQ